MTLPQLLQKILELLPRLTWCKTDSKIVSGGTVTPVKTARYPPKKGEMDKLMLKFIFYSFGILAAQQSTKPYDLSDSLRSVG